MKLAQCSPGPRLGCGRQPLSTRHAVCHAAAAMQQDVDFTWREPDAFSALDDRKDMAPLPLPDVDFRRRIVLVRHGQSTWNAEGRIQGSSDFSELTPKGIAQAEVARDMLRGETFDALFVSPLTRARQTADIIAGAATSATATATATSSSSLSPVVLPSLREIDLYSFQGLLKAQGKERFGPQYASWQTAAAEFSLDGHAPVRELWYRASLAWQQLLAPDTGEDEAGALCSLVVAHNAVNQALICSALGLPPVFFRRLLQSNAATTVLDVQPAPPEGAGTGRTSPASSSSPPGRPRVTLDRLNQSPGRPYQPEGSGRGVAGRLVLVRHAATPGTADRLLLGTSDEPLSSLGLVQAGKTAEFLMDMKVSTVVTSPQQRCILTAKLIADLQREAAAGDSSGSGSGSGSGGSGPRVLMMPELQNLDVGGWQGKPTRLVQGQPFPDDAEQLGLFWQRTAAAWDKLREAAAEGGGANVVVVGHAAVHAALVCHCLGLGPDGLSLFRFDTAGVNIIDFPDGPTTPAPGGGAGVLRCLNYTAHLGRWAAPISRDDLDGVCGIDGCF